MLLPVKSIYFMGLEIAQTFVWEQIIFKKNYNYNSNFFVDIFQIRKFIWNKKNLYYKELTADFPSWRVFWVYLSFFMLRKNTPRKKVCFQLFLVQVFLGLH
jgi:hypothetical protein